MRLITRQDLKAKLDNNQDIKLIMAVGPWEFRAKHIPGSLGFPSPRYALYELRSDDEIIIYANNHYRVNTAAAYDALRAHGYRDVRCYAGGLADWEAAGYPARAIPWALAPTTVGLMGTAHVGGSCAASAPTAITAGPGPVGRRHQLS
jgi:rhodanese-related sulfurtransferase